MPRAPHIAPRRLAAGLAASAMICLAVPGLAAGAGGLELGIQDPLSGGFQERDRAHAYEAVRGTGVRIVRVPVSWTSIAPREPDSPRDPADPRYDWTGLDERVSTIVGHGLTPLLYPYNTPTWAAAKSRHSNALKAPRTRSFAAFARALARRYSGTPGGPPRVRLWQIWNEPNITVYWSRDKAATRYRAIVNAGYKEFHAVRRDNTVVAGGLGPFGNKTGSVAFSPLRFMRQMLCMSRGRRSRPTCKAKVSFDVWSHHPYTSGGPNHGAIKREDVSLADLPKMRRLLRRARSYRHIAPRMPRFWATEFSWDTKGPDPWGVPVRVHGRWVAEALYRMWRSGVSLVVWFQLRDNPKGPAWGTTWQAGLYRRTTRLYADERPNPALRAIRFPFVAVPERGRITLWGRTPGGARRAVVVERRRRGRWVRVVRTPANGHGLFRLRRGGLRGALLRARSGGVTSLPFRAVRTRDRRVNPFGGPLRR